MPLNLRSTSSSLAKVFLAASLFLTTQQLFADDIDNNIASIEGLPPEAPRTGTLITIDVAKNKIYLFEDGELVDESPVATGSEKVLKNGHTIFLFHTPRGRMTVLRKIEDPVWTKPDWAFIEDGQRIPPADSPQRHVRGHLGKYALDLGDGIMIHGTDDARSIGKRESHGCIRVPGSMLETMWNAAKVGTEVYVFESGLPTQHAAGRVERHSDLDF
jgi:L,D-transpeptidase ErfK/SrfK